MNRRTAYIFTLHARRIFFAVEMSVGFYFCANGSPIFFYFFRFCIMISYWAIKKPHSEWHFSVTLLFFQLQISQNEMPLAVNIWKFPAQTEHEWAKNQISLHSTELPMKYLNSSYEYGYGSAKIIDLHSQNHRFSWRFSSAIEFYYIHLIWKGFIVQIWNWFLNENCSTVNQSVPIFSILINQECASLSTLWVRWESRFHSKKSATSSYTKHIGEL